MNLYFWVVQIIGVIAWLVLLVSYYRKDTDHILTFQIIATILYCIHYYLLGAYSGLFICLFEVLRDYLYYKTEIDDYIFIGSIPIYIILGIFSFNTVIDLFPILASAMDGFSLTKRKQIVVVGAILTYTLWVIYDIYVMSLSCAITDGMVVLSNLSILLFQYNIFGFKNKNRAFPKKTIH